MLCPVCGGAVVELTVQRVDRVTFRACTRCAEHSSWTVDGEPASVDDTALALR